MNLMNFTSGLQQRFVVQNVHPSQPAKDRYEIAHTTTFLEVADNDGWGVAHVHARAERSTPPALRLTCHSRGNEFLKTGVDSSLRNPLINPSSRNPSFLSVSLSHHFFSTPYLYSFLLPILQLILGTTSR